MNTSYRFTAKVCRPGQAVCAANESGGMCRGRVSSRLGPACVPREEIAMVSGADAPTGDSDETRIL